MKQIETPWCYWPMICDYWAYRVPVSIATGR